MNKVKTEIGKVREIVSELIKWQANKKTSPVLLEKFGQIESEESRDMKLELYSFILETLELDPSSDYHYISGIIHNENLEIEKGKVLILSPVGSGKTTFIKTYSEEKENALVVVPYLDDYKKNSKVITYDEFYSNISENKSFLDSFEVVLFDEFQKSFEPSFANNNDFFNEVNKDIKFICFSSSESKEFKNKMKEKSFEIYDYNTEKIKKYVPDAHYEFNYVPELKEHFEAKYKGFNYYGYKILVFCKAEHEQQKIFEIANNEGFNPLILSSTKNSKLKRQIENTGLVPEEFNCLIVDDIQELYNYNNEDLKLVIIDSVLEMEKIRLISKLNYRTEIISYVSNC